MTVLYDADSDVVADTESSPPDASAPSNNCRGVVASADVPEIDFYEMLTQGTRIWDQEEGRIYERLLAEPSALMPGFMQKVWRLLALFRYDQCPDELLQYLRAHVGFGDGQGPATALAEQLDFAQTRQLISIATKLWRRRGRLDVLSDAIQTFASGVPPRIITWFWRAPLVDAIAVGSSDLPSADLGIVVSEHFDEASVSDAYETLLRVPDYGSLDRDVVEALADLSRPAHERFHIAYVDFVDTFSNGRLGHWSSVDGVPASFEPGDATADPFELPWMVLTRQTIEKIATPTSASWTDYTVLFTAKFGPEEKGGVEIRYFYQDEDNYAAFRLQPDPFASGVNGWVYSRVVVNGIDTTIGYPVGGIAGAPPLRAPSVVGVMVDIATNASGAKDVTLYVDEFPYITMTVTGLDRGTVAFTAQLEQDARVGMVEVFQKPLATTTLS